MKEKKFEKRCPGPVDCFGDREVLFRKVLIPMAMGDDTKYPPKNGAYRNSLVVYEANGAIYIYSSDGLYTKLSVASGVNSVNGMSGDVNLFIPEKLSELQNDTGFITKDVDDLTNYPKLSDLAQVAVSGSYLDLSNKPAINNGQLTINRNGSTIGSFKANQSQDTTVNIRVPVYTNELINNSQFVVDGNYVHTDNNFNNEWKNKLAGLANIQTIGNNLTLTNGRLDTTVPPGGVTSVNGKTGAVVLNASDVHALPDTTVIPTVNDATLTIQKNGVAVATFSANSSTDTIANITTSDDIVITIGVDGGGNMVWSGANSIADVRNAFNNGGSLRVEAPLLTNEIYNITEVWWKDSNQDTLIVQSVDNDAALIQIGLADDYSVEMDNVNLQEKLQAGANISINGNTISASVPIPPTRTSQLINDGSDNTSTYVEADELATVATSGSYTDLADKPTPFQIRTKLTANTDLNNRTPGIWPVENIAHPDFPVAGAMYGALIQYPDTYKTQVLLAGEAAGSGNENNMYYRRWLTGSSSWTAWQSASGGGSITTDTELNNTSTNPVQNQALYPAIVGSEIRVPVYTSAWSEPAGSNPYNSVAIITLPTGTFTDNSLIELTINDQFDFFAKYGFVLYGHETETQRLWLTSIGKPTSTVYLTFRIYKYGS